MMAHIRPDIRGKLGTLKKCIMQGWDEHSDYSGYDQT